MITVKKYFILLWIMISTTLLWVSAKHYPGGSPYDKNSIGYDRKNNYPGNLFSNKTINGLDDPSRLWVICGLFFLLNE